MARSYLRFRDAGEHKKADFLVVEMVDQCVRRESGGELGKLYCYLRGSEDSTSRTELIDFVRVRTGEQLALPGFTASAGGGGGCQPICAARHAEVVAAIAAGVDSTRAPWVAWRIPRTKRQPGGRWRETSMALEFPSTSVSVGRGRLHRCLEMERQQQFSGGLPVLSSRPRRRRKSAQRYGVDVRGGIQAGLASSVVASPLENCND